MSKQPGTEVLENSQAIEQALEQQGKDIQVLLERRRFTRSGQTADGLEGEDGGFDPVASQRGFQAHPVKAVTVALEWRNLTYTVRVGRGKKATTKTILDRLSGVAPPAHLLAIMGPTGSGKTSLINALAGRLEGGALGGSILVNGRDRRKNFKNISAYVMQDDVLLGVLTVRETFEVAAALRLPRKMTKGGKGAIVDTIITELGLSKAANTRIGDAFTRGVSGGERKRVAFGQALLGNPAVIFLDEPTSGLDAFQSQNVMEALRRLAQGGRTVLSTIHQPRSSIFAMFDLLLLIAEGKTLYYGPAHMAVSHFERCHMPCPQHFNPADFFLDVASVDNRSPEAEAACQERIKLLEYVYNQDRSQYEVVTQIGDGDMTGLPGKFSFATDWFTQYGVLQRRAFKQVAREKVPIIITGVQVIVIGVIIGLLYLNMNKDYKGITDRTGLLFFVIIFTAFSSLLPVINLFPREKAMVARERAAKSFRVSAYYVAKQVASAPLRIGSLLVFAAIMYWMTGLRDSAAAFFKFWLVVVLEGLAAGAMGLAISAGCKRADAASALAPGLMIIMILFGGFYVNPSTIPVWLRWIRYISFIFWAYVSLSINEFKGACCWGCSPGSAPGCSLTGDQIVSDQLFLGERKYWEGVVALIGLTVALNLLAYWILRRSIPKFLPLSNAEEKDASPAAGKASSGSAKANGAVHPEAAVAAEAKAMNNV